MENSLVKSTSAVISEESGFTDNRGSDDGCGKGMSGGVNDGGKNVKKRKGSGNVGLGEGYVKVKKSRSSVDNGGSGSGKDLGQGLERSGGLNGFSVGLDGGDDIRVPRKKRGSAGSKVHVAKMSGSSSSVDQSGQMESDLRGGAGVVLSVPLHAKKKRGQVVVDKGKSVDQTEVVESDLKDCKTDMPSIPQLAKKKRGQLVVGKGKSVDQSEVLESDLKDCETAVPSISQHAKKKSKELIGDEGNSDDQIAKLESDIKDGTTAKPRITQHGKKRREPLISEKGTSVNQTSNLNSDQKDHTTAILRIPQHPKKRREPLAVDKGSSVDQTANLNSDQKDHTTAIPRIPQHPKKRREPLVVDKGSSVDLTANLNSDQKDHTTAIPRIPQHPKKRREPLVVDKGSSVDQTANMNPDQKNHTTTIPRIPQHDKKRREPMNVDKGSPVDQTANLNSDAKDTTSAKPNILESDEKRIEQLVIDKGDLVDQTAMLNSDLKDSMPALPSTPQHAKKRRKKLISDEGKVSDASSKKEQSHRKKRKGIPLDGLEFAEKAQPAAGRTASISEDSMDDEENLEKNAAMMLSSRFDPRCTGPSSKSKSSLSHSGGDTGSHVENLQASSECPSPDNASRLLRPRYNHKEKGCPRKRRHFYEVVYKDKDPRWFLNKRIKVFWPLDERWYHGLVNDYDEERKLHHVKYDDKDKEWIKLQNERFMLLLLRSEVTGVGKPLQSCSEDKMTDETRKGLTMSETDTNSGNHLESEPIISWLARSNRAKSLAGVKKQKTFHPSPSDSPSSRNFTNAHTKGNVGLLEKETSGVLFSDSVDRLVAEADGGEVMSKHRSSLKENGLPTVYFRRRFRQKKDASVAMPVNNNVQISLPTVDRLSTVADRFSTSDKENVLLDCMDTSKLILLIGSDGMSKLNLALLPFKEFVTQVSLPVLCLLDLFGFEMSRYLRLSLLQQYGSVVSTWPTVYFEMLFVDNEVGLRFFLLEGCLKETVAFVFVVLNMFFDTKKQGEPVDLQIPVTSIRFKFSCTQDLRKQHIFSFYSFSKLKYSNWSHLDSIFQKQCIFSKKLPLPECTLGNIQAFESGNKQIHINSVSWQSSFQGTRRKSFQDIIPIGLSKPGKENRSQPSNCNVMHGILPLALSFSAAPLLFRSLHLKLLMRSNIACVRLRECTLTCSLDHGEATSKSTINDCTIAKHGSEISTQVVPESTPRIFLSDDAHSGCLSLSDGQLETHPLSASMNCNRVMSSLHDGDKSLDAAKTYTCSSDGVSIGTDVIGHSLNRESHNPEPERLLALKSRMSYKDQGSSVISGDSDCHNLNSMSVEIPETDLAKSSVLGKSPGVQRVSDYVSPMSDGIITSPNTVSPKSFWTANTRNLSSSPLGEMSPVWHGERTNAVHSGFGNGPRRPRTQVHYAMPFGGSEFSPRHKPPNQNGLPFRRVRRASEKRTSDDSKGSQRNLELLACDSNVLITLGDRCWREFGARVTLELADQNEWRLAVKFSGSTRYSHKVHHVFQPGSTNRYTHAMMWKGGKDWALEFPDRGQWMLFKEMHEECYNRNIRAASVKNIPIPGVHLVEECEAITEKLPFTRSPNLFKQIEDDIDMAMNFSKILYDMDSEDEEWILRNENSFQNQGTCHVTITDDLFEKTMDTLEKVAYAQRRDDFTVAELENLMAGVLPSEVINAIYQHWQQKRKKTGFALIRHLQPPSWEIYQQKMQEWNQLMTKANTAAASGGRVKKPPPVEKPAMFAFCLKPRGLEVPNKGSKHRSQKKLHTTHALVGDQDGVHTFGRRSNSFAVRDEKATYPDYSPENSDTSPSTRIYSPSDVCSHEYFSLNNDTSDFDNHPKLYKNKSKKIGALMPRSNLHALPTYNHRTPGKRNGVQRRDLELPDRPIQMHYQSQVYPGPGNMQLGVRDLDEFSLREATSAAKRASIIAMLKREKAQRLLYRADLAINVAASAIMTADALKASYCPNEDKNASSSE